MEQNLPVIAKRIWGIVRVVYFMLRKGITSKRKLLLDLNMIMKRGKLASKAALSNLMTFHVSSSSFRRSSSAADLSALPVGEYEFSCSNTPNYGPFHLISKNGHHHRRHAHHFFACAHAPPTHDDDVAAANAIKAVLEIINNNDQSLAAAVEASPALPGFGLSPAVVRQLRITDSPFPLRESDDVDSRQVDEAAEEFIKRFYKDLKQQRRNMAD
ncbi:hypothetical protein L484_026266 [Morus notabilis]|uniref:Avr9/Cf-9 rapidly elicited protein 146 n=1 Tax=Morus notabilis TaxID=981085 RepID=W9REJ2_9ROSA|nr:uncharacterized protein LOC21408929 [Morus notabilis]EXB74569.1 hypothetical protein L484_026266 [Morus notabilis]